MAVITSGLNEHIDEQIARFERMKNLKEFTLKAVLVLSTNFWPKRWRKQVAPSGKRWTKWSQKYKDRLAKIGKAGNRILFDRGDMLNSVALGRSTVTKADEESFTIGTNDPKAASHQFGRDGIPPRPFLGFSKRDLKFLDTGLSEFILRGKTP